MKVRRSEQRALLAVLFIAVIVFSTGNAVAYERTLFDDGEFSFGAYGGPSVLFSQFNGENAVMPGMSAALVVNNSFYLGCAGYGMATEHDAPAYDYEPMRFQMGYGGAWMGVVIKSDNIVHASADVLIGAGAITRSYSYYDDYDYDSHNYNEDIFFVVQPMANVEMNITSWMRMTAGVGYRFTDSVEKYDLVDDDVSGIVSTVGFKFGRF